MMVSKNKIKTIGLIVFTVLFVSGLLYRCISDFRSESLLQIEGRVTMGNLDKYGSVMGANYVHFTFTVDNIDYSGTHPISKSRVKKWLIGTDDLEILYYPDDPSIHKLIDTRFN